MAFEQRCRRRHFLQDSGNRTIFRRPDRPGRGPGIRGGAGPRRAPRPRGRYGPDAPPRRHVAVALGGRFGNQGFIGPQRTSPMSIHIFFVSGGADSPTDSIFHAPRTKARAPRDPPANRLKQGRVSLSPVPSPPPPLSRWGASPFPPSLQFRSTRPSLFWYKRKGFPSTPPSISCSFPLPPQYIPAHDGRGNQLRHPPQRHRPLRHSRGRGLFPAHHHHTKNKKQELEIGGNVVS